MLEYAKHLEVLKTTKETPEFAVRLQQELIELDRKLAALSPVFDVDSKILMTANEARILQQQYEAMQGYYYALIERCKLHKVIDMAISYATCSCTD